MKPAATSREEILASARKIVQQKGLAGVGMRSVAAEAGVAAGTLYHYFPDKDALLLAVTADIWSDIFDLDSLRREGDGFAAATEELFCHASRRMQAYPGFPALHGLALSFGGGPAKKGTARMHAFLGKVERHLWQALQKDAHVRSDAFSNGMDEQGFVAFVLDHLLLLLMLGSRDCSVLVAVIERVLY